MKTQLKNALPITSALLIFALAGLVALMPQPLVGQTCIQPPSELVGWWSGEGNASDFTGTSDGVLQNGATFANGEVGQAFSFMVSNASVRIPATPALNVGTGPGFTVEGWIKPADLSTSRVLFEWNDGFFGVLFLVNYPSPGALHGDTKDDGFGTHNINSAPSLLVTNAFQHVALTYDQAGGVAFIYLNGAQVASANVGSITPRTVGDFYLGIHPSDGFFAPFLGQVDEVAMYSRALDPSEIQGIYAAGHLGKCGPPLAIQTQPQSQTAIAGSNVLFNVVAIGSPPILYQWQFNGTNIAGATNATLILTNVQPPNQGAYVVQISDASSASLASGEADLTVQLVAPTIDTQPQNQSGPVGSRATFFVVAEGSLPLSYQWRFGGANIAGATQSSLVVSNIQLANFGTYSVVVSNAAGSQVSADAFLTQASCTQPVSGLVGWWPGEGSASDFTGTSDGVLQNGATFTNGVVGQAFSFMVSNASVRVPATPALNVGAGTGFTVEAWIKPADLSTPRVLWEWNNGSFGPLFLINYPSPGALHGDTKDTSFSDHNINSASNLLVTNAFQHVALTFDQASSTGVIYLNGALVAQTNVGFITPRTYGDFYLGIHPTDGFFNPFLGQVDEVSLYSRALSASEIQNIYALGHIGKCGPPLAVQTQPQSQTANAGSNVFFSVAAIGSPAILYQWQFNGANIAGATNATLFLTNVQPPNQGAYVVQISDSSGASLASAEADLTVQVIPPIIDTQPMSQSSVIGGAASFFVVAEGSPPLRYQWRLGGANIAGATQSSLVLTNLQLASFGTYSVFVSNGGGSQVSADAVLSQATCTQSTSNLVAWWRGETDALDAFGTNNGVLQNGATFTAGEVGLAFSFMVSNASVRVPATSALNVGTGSGFTVEAWIKPADLSTPRVLWEWNNGSFGPLFLINYPSPGALHGDTKDIFFNDHNINSTSNLLVTNAFQHVALTYDQASSNAVIYLNGAPVAQTNVSSATPRTLGDFYVGIHPADGFFNPFVGQVDDLSLYSRALTASEIQAIYNAGGAGKCVPQLPPSFNSQPPNLTSVSIGSNLNLTASVHGTSPLSLQWRFNGVDLPGATNSSLTVTNMQPANAGNYTLAVTNALGAAISSNAVVKVPVVFMYANGQLLTNAQYILANAATIQLSNVFTNGDIFYTLDGSTPTFFSPLYSAPLVVTQSCVLQALGYSADFSQSGISGPVSLIIAPSFSLTNLPTGGGTVSFSPPTGPYLSNTVVTLIATPAAGWTFLQWSGDTSSASRTNNLVMNANKTVKALFGTTLSNTVAGAGTVMRNPAGTVYPYGTSVQLSAIPQPGNFFALWGNAASSNLNPLTFVVTNPNPVISSLFAGLSAGQVSLTVVPVGHGHVSVNPRANAYTNNAPVTITATPDVGQSFLGWSGDASGAQNPLNVSMTQSRVIYANFTRPNNLTLTIPQPAFSAGMQLNLVADVPNAFRFDASSDLTTWTTLTTLTNWTGTLQYTDLSATNSPRRFYRSVPLP